MSTTGVPPSGPLRPSMEYGANALTAPTTPSRRMPVVDKTKVDPQLRAAAENMEAMFLDYMMKVMRQSIPKNELDLENPATEIYRGMMDSETAQKAAKAGGIGIADQIIAYMQEQRYNQMRPPTGQVARAPAGEHGKIDQVKIGQGGQDEGRTNGQ